MDQIREVRIYRESSAHGDYDRIKVVIGDLHLRADVTNDRDARLALNLAKSHGAPFFCDPRVSEETKAALGIDESRSPELRIPVEHRAEWLAAQVQKQKIAAAEDAVVADLKRMGLA